MARRPQVLVQASPVSDRLTAPSTNPALQLASALADIEPTAAAFTQQRAQDLTREAAIRAKTDAVRTSGAAFADAVRDGTIEATQNPFYMDAYRRESAQVRGAAALANVVTDSQTWEERNDPAAYQERLNREVGLVGETVAGGDEEAQLGFLAAANPVLQQQIASNTAQNVQRITQEREANAGAVAATAIGAANRAAGGNVAPSQVRAALTSQREDYFATGGTQAGWDKIVTDAVTTAAYNAGDTDLIDLLKDPTLRGMDAGPVPDPPVPEGAAEVGNIDLAARPVVTNEDGSISTVRSMSFEEDGVEVLIPTVSPDGRVLSDEDAMVLYRTTGQHLGKFETPEAATAYAERLHAYQAALYAPGGEGVQSLYNLPGIAADLESTQYRIRQGVIDRLTFQETATRAEDQARGRAFQAELYEKYDDQLLLGNLPVQEIIDFGQERGYSMGAIAQALSQTNSQVQQIQSLQNARFNAIGLDPEQGQAVIRLFTDVARNPTAPGLAGRIDEMYLAGTLSPDDTTRLHTQIGNAQGAAAGAGGAGGGGGGNDGGADSVGRGPSGAARVRSLTALNQRIEQLAYGAATSVGNLSESSREGAEEAARNAAMVFLASHPGDYQGAELAASNGAVIWARRRLAAPAAPARPASTRREPGGNPRR